MNIKTYIQNINEKLELENDNVLKLLQEAFFATNNNYGYNHARTALEALITKNDLRSYYKRK